MMAAVLVVARRAGRSRARLAGGSALLVEEPTAVRGRAEARALD